MGKVDDMRAMREARFSERAQKVMKKVEDRKVTRASEIDNDKGAPYQQDDLLCGHANISGKTCTRPKGHTEKNHRYK